MIEYIEWASKLFASRLTHSELLTLPRVYLDALIRAQNKRLREEERQRKAARQNGTNPAVSFDPTSLDSIF
jgi:hypothetical protein